MFKFLRRYSKWILAVGGTLLLVTFLIPYAFQGLGQMAATRGATWATMGPDDTKVSVYDQSLLQREKRIIDLLNPSQRVQQVTIESVQHWFLLSHMAEEVGLVGGQQEALSLLGETPEIVLGSINQQTGDPADFILQTVAKYRGVNRLVALFSSAGHFSDRRLRQQAKELFHSTSAKFVVIPSAAEDATMEPTEEQIKAQYEKYADMLPGEGDRGFGYKLPNRVKLEWIKVNAEAVRATVKSSPDYNDIALRKHWRANPDSRFPAVPENGGPIPEIVKTDLEQVLFNKKMDEITRFIADYLRDATRGLARAGSYYNLPEDWEARRPKLPALAAKLQEEFGLELPAYQSIGDRWLSAEDVSKLEGVGTATTDHFGTQAMPLATIVRQLKEFGDPIDAVVQEGVAGPPLRDALGSIYIFRITATDASRRANGVDEVREQVVNDLKRVADYDQIVANKAALESKARAEGVLSLLIDDPRAEFFPQQNVSLASIDNLMIQAQLGFPLTAVPSPLPVVGRDKAAVEAIIEHAMSLPLLAVESLSPEQRIFAVPVDDKLTMLVLEITTNKPATSEDFVRAVDMGVVQVLLLNQELDNGTAVVDTFDYDALASRYNFKLSRTPEELEEEADNAKTANANTGG